MPGCIIVVGFVYDRAFTVGFAVALKKLLGILVYGGAEDSGYSGQGCGLYNEGEPLSL